MKYDFIFEEYSLVGEYGNHFIFDVRVTVHGDAPDNLEIASVSFHKEGMQPLEMTETQFVSLFPGADDIINNAFEDASTEGDYYV